MVETEILRHIHDNYGAFIAASAARHGHRPEVLAGIMCRETQGGLSPLLDAQGPEGRGDGGRGHGLMQLDDRSFPEFIRSGNWRDPAKNIEFGALVLRKKRLWLERVLGQTGITTDLERAAISSYNVGEGNVLKSLKAGRDVDARTAHGNYSRDVLRLAELYRTLT